MRTFLLYVAVIVAPIGVGATYLMLDGESGESRQGSVMSAPDIPDPGYQTP